VGKTVAELELEHVLEVLQLVCKLLVALEPILKRQIKARP